MKKLIPFLLISLIMLLGLLTGCDEPKQKTTWWNNIRIEVMQDPKTVYNLEMQPEISYDQFTVMHLYKDDAKDTMSFKQTFLDKYSAYLTKCGLTFADGIQGFYTDEACTTPITPAIKVQKAEWGVSDGPSYFEIYTKVDDAIWDSNTSGVKGKYTEFYIFDTEKNVYINNGSAGVSYALLPPQTKKTDITEYIFKNHGKTSSDQHFLDNAEYGSIKYYKFHVQALKFVTEQAKNAPDYLSSFGIVLPTDMAIYDFKEGDNMQGCTMFIYLNKSFKKLGLSEGEYQYPTSDVTFKDKNNKEIVVNNQKIPYETTSQSLIDILNKYLSDNYSDVSAEYKTDDIETIIVSTKTWTEGSDESLKGEDVTVKLKNAAFPSSVVD